MRRLAIVLLLALSASSCAWRSVPSSENWFVESYSSGILTVQHEGHEYTASCDFGTSFNAPNSGKPDDWQYSPHLCDAALELVKKEIQPFGGRRRDEKGRIVNMWTVGDLLVLRCWENEHTPWRQEHFKVTSVTEYPLISAR